MTEPADGTGSGTAQVSRRRVLVGGASAAVCVAALPHVASAQGMTAGVIPSPDRWDGADLAGFEITLGDDGEGTATPGTGGDEEGGDGGDGGEGGGTATNAGTEGAGGTDAGTAGAGEDGTPDCDFREWPPESVASHDATLINRTESDTPEVDTTLYTSAEANVEEDGPYLVNSAQECESDYVGVELVSVEGADREENDQVEEVEGDPTETGPGGDGVAGGDAGDETAADGPGFGALAAVAAVVGGVLFGRRGED